MRTNIEKEYSLKSIENVGLGKNWRKRRAEKCQLELSGEFRHKKEACVSVWHVPWRELEKEVYLFWALMDRKPRNLNIAF